ncbi:MAG: CBS domain-containing protein [Gammaproteobacteria bacterium]|nr:CBS domain-containing protein [Gammaproteobacteria bacterium]
MMPAIAADTLARLETAVAAEILFRMPNETAVLVMRALPRALHNGLFRAMPRASALRLRVQMRYPEALIGSLVDPDAVSLLPEQRVADALRLMRGGRQRVSHQLYMVTGERRLIGYVELTRLIAARERTPLSRLVQPAPLTSNARAPLHTAEDLDIWLEFDSLPVVDRRGTFQGVLRREAIRRKGRSLLSGISSEREFGRTRTALADIFWLAVGSLLAPATPQPPVDRRDD